MKTPHILMMAAGTGGHVFPALAVSEELTKRGAVIHWLGTPNGMENGLVAPTGYPFHAIDMQGLRGKGLGRLLKLPVTLLSATMAAIKVIRGNQIDVVVGFGGYVTAPGGIAARLTKTPLIIHEQNAIAGMSNRYLAKMATKVLQAFENTLPIASMIARLKRWVIPCAMPLAVLPNPVFVTMSMTARRLNYWWLVVRSVRKC